MQRAVTPTNFLSEELGELVQKPHQLDTLLLGRGEMRLAGLEMNKILVTCMGAGGAAGGSRISWLLSCAVRCTQEAWPGQVHEEPWIRGEEQC